MSPNPVGHLFLASDVARVAAESILESAARKQAWDSLSEGDYTQISLFINLLLREHVDDHFDRRISYSGLFEIYLTEWAWCS